VKYGLSPQPGNAPSKAWGSTDTAYPSDSNSRRRNPSPSRQGRTAILARRGSAVSAVSERSRLFPESADPNTREIATLKNEDAA
jgi:hypothetical protein